ncbi:MAG: transmembrane 18-like, partial [Trebouxia sp. A1-2]
RGMNVLQEASNVLDQLLVDVRSKFADSQHQQGVLDAFRAFSSAVNWQESWLIAVLSIQTLLFCSVLLFRRNTSYLTGVFVVAMLLVYTSERLNRVLGQHWRSFAGQPYFDKNGIFISAVLSAPLVLDMLVILVCYLLSLSRMLVAMKRQELRHKARQRANQQPAQETKKTS